MDASAPTGDRGSGGADVVGPDVHRGLRRPAPARLGAAGGRGQAASLPRAAVAAALVDRARGRREADYFFVRWYEPFSSVVLSPVAMWMFCTSIWIVPVGMSFWESRLL